MGGSLTLILGGARSGKSAEAQRLAGESGGPVLFVATGQALDEEMRLRIERHRAERPAHWVTLEAPRRAGEAIAAAGERFQAVVVDCLTLLASNASLDLGASPDPRAVEAAVEAEVDGLLGAFRAQASGAAWFVVSNEVGLGVVPETPLGRAYRDALGRAHQRLAAASSRVILMVAGIPLRVK